MEQHCPFCSINEKRILLENKYIFAVYDKYPVSDGHALIITKEHKRDYFTINNKERQAVFSLMDDCKKLLDNKFNPDGYKFGVNCGREAGQTIMHFHLHLIPRYLGDAEDPTGGVRGVIPKKRIY